MASRNSSDTLPRNGWRERRQARAEAASDRMEVAGRGILREIVCKRCGHRRRLRLTADQFDSTFRCSQCGKKVWLRSAKTDPEAAALINHYP